MKTQTESFGSPSPPQGLATASVDEFSEALQAFDLEIVPTGPASGLWELQRCVVPEMTIHHGCFGAPSVVLGAAQPAHLEFVLPWVLNAPIRYRGSDMTGRLGLYGPGTSHEAHCDSPQGFTVISIGCDAFAEQLAPLEPQDIELPGSGHFVAPSCDAAIERELRDAVLALLDQWRHPPAREGPVLEHRTRTMTRRVLNVLLQVMADTHEATGPDTRNLSSGGRVLARIREHLHQEPDQLPELEDLCRIGQTGLRNLQLIFRRHLGITPNRFLRYRRLHHARRLLETRSVPSVKAAALDSGFRELGRFAVEYRKCFGEAPSVTLYHASPNRALESARRRQHGQEIHSFSRLHARNAEDDPPHARSAL